MTTNQTRVIGPNQAATLPVPCRCAANSRNRMAVVITMTKGSSAGVTSLSPSTADSTEMAGVIRASP